ncbi:MAG: TolC family protein, partial [Phycisphaeraceae bacterium]
MARTLLMPALSALILLTLLGPGGCTGPLDRSEEEALRDSLLAAQRNHLQSLRQGQAVELQRPPSEVEQALPPQRIEQLDAVSGPEAYEDAPLPLTRGLLGGDEVEIVRISLQEAIEQAVRHNLDYQFAQISPAIAETRLLQAEAVFDATVFASVNWTNLDTPQPSGAIAGLAGDRQSQDLEVVTGIRKPLTTGGQASIETSVRRQEEEPTFFGVSSYYDADVLASLRQPLLRNFGQGVNLARVQLAASARNQEVQRLRQTLLELAFQVEQTYWRLLLAQQRVLIRQRLL